MRKIASRVSPAQVPQTAFGGGAGLVVVVDTAMVVEVEAVKAERGL